MKRLGKKISSKYRKIHSKFNSKNLSLADISRFLFLALGTYLLFLIPLWVTIDSTLSSQQNMSFNNWLSISIASFGLLCLTYFRDNVRDKRANKLIVSDKIIYDLIGGVIQELTELKGNSYEGKGHYLIEVLNSIEKVIFAILNASGKQIGHLCVNIMEKTDGKLKVTQFATKFQDRDKPSVDLNFENPGPGAPLAWVKKKVIYVSDISAAEYNSYFDGDFKFKSFISLPLLIEGTVCAIVNIDSNITNQFESNDYIARNIIPKINPFLLLLGFEKDLFIHNEEKNGNSN